MRVLITGASGQAGWELQRTAPAEAQVFALDSRELDLTDGAAVKVMVAEIKPALVINAAAYTAVDRAEQERDAAYAVNRDGAGYLAQAARGSDARLIHLSTDFVFDGGSSTPCRPQDPPRPLGVYGASKLAGEERVLQAAPEALIIRTAWLYSSHGANFVKTMLRLMSEREELGVIADQVGSPTWARGLAEAVWGFALRPGLKGIFHWSDAGVASWYDFALAIQEEALALGRLQRTARIRPLRTEEYPTAAKRPSYSVLDKSAAWSALNTTGRHWRANLRAMLQELD